LFCFVLFFFLIIFAPWGPKKIQYEVYKRIFWENLCKSWYTPSVVRQTKEKKWSPSPPRKLFLPYRRSSSRVHEDTEDFLQNCANKVWRNEMSRRSLGFILHQLP
jgi:hypothetical protein